MELSRDFPVSILVGDLDNLKTTNDMFGHAEGDKLIRTVARMLQETFRVGDVIAGIGGDEFAVLLPKTDSLMAGQMLSRVQAKLNERNNAFPDQPVHFSIGISTEEKGDLMEALNAADRNMYVNKAIRKSEK